MRRLSCLLLVALVPSTSEAQNGADIDLQGFHPAMDSRGLITVNASQVLAAGEPSFGLVTTWGRGLLRFEGNGNRYEVENMVTPTFIGALGFRLFGLALEAGAALPFTIMSGDRAPDAGGATPDDPNDDVSYRFDGQGLADASLHLKWQLLLRRPGLGLAVIGSVSLPTASRSDLWLGDGTPVPQVVAVADYQRGRFGVAANAGMRWRRGDRFTDDAPAAARPPAPSTSGVIEAGSAIPFGLGASFAVVPDRFEAVVELFGAAPLAGENYFPLEVLGGIKVYLAQSSYLSLGAGAGLLSDRGANPDARAFLAIVFEPRAGQRVRDAVPDVVVRCCRAPAVRRPPLPARDLVIEREWEIEILDVIQFEFDSAVIREQSHDILRAVATAIMHNPAIELVEVQGHTDERGSAAYNLDLSQRRASSVLDFLVGEGVAPDHLVARGYGESMPLVHESNELAWAENRRVEFIIARKRR